jgi:hypothetical protein
MAKGAQEFAEDLVREVKWLENTAIVLKEQEVGARNNVNWAVTTGPLSTKPAEELERILTAKRNANLQLDWKGIEVEGDGRRTMVRWVSA